ncbi:MAG: acyltransferase [Pseudolabrys sp.]
MRKPNVALSNLRAVVIIIVLAFHSALAYLASAPAPHAAFDRAPYTWVAFPIVDTHHWLGFDIFCAWQDVSLMALMFFLSGLLTSGSLMRKGTRIYIADRVWRIGLPFALAALLLSPLAYYPAYITRTAEPTFVGFWRQWFSLSSWPAGPEWFLWQLFVANAFAALLYAVAPGYIGFLRRLAAWVGDRPITFFALLAGISAVGYVPLALAFSPWKWSSLGPFSLQLCRPVVYLVFFFAGFALGSYGLDRGLLAPDGPLARRWWAWLAAAGVGFGLWAGLTSLTLPDWNAASLATRLGASFAFPLGCAAGGLFLLSGALRLSRVRSRALDSLSINAYSMYLVHYIFVVWLQYALLNAGLIAAAKLAIVLTGAMVMSWASSAGFGRLMAGPLSVTGKRAVSPVPR